MVLILLLFLQSFGGLEGVEVDPSNSSNLIFTFRSRSIANQVRLMKTKTHEQSTVIESCMYVYNTCGTKINGAVLLNFL